MKPAATEQQTEGAERNYRKTLNLPQTAFPMKANLVQNEPASVKRWKAEGVYAQLRAQAAAGARTERFLFHDGPPYANGSIHLGHLLNKCLKDFVVRTQSMAGRDCPFVPGWDCHGLPIEHKVMTEMMASGKAEKLRSLEEDVRRMAVRKACQAAAEKFQKLQAGQMERLLTIGDYDHPYMTMLPEYEGAVLEVFADLVEQGLVYRDLKPVHWSIANETALAEAELEYYDREDPSVYVEFEAADRGAVEKAFGLEADALGRTPTFMIWTTTPWTLPANLAIAVHDRLSYSLVEIDGSITVLATELVESVAKRARAETVRTIATATGDRLIGLAYRHPFVDGAALAKRLGAKAPLHRIVAADYVTVEDGTGLVHTAPGHGAEDYRTGLKENIPIYCPVRNDGTYDDTVPDWIRGKTVWDANPVVTEHLRDSGHLFHDERFTHSYPHDWRGKSPVIFRATEQWFVSVEKPAKREKKSLRQSALDSTARGVAFVPEWGRNRMRGMLETRPDWCISRQRAWGLPLPAFFAPDGRALLTPASVRAVAQAVREKGSDCWFTENPAQLLRHYDAAKDPDAPKGLDVASLVKGGDILDVWFESGSSWNAVMRERSGRGGSGRDYPVDLYLEGSDQHRGWFQSSLLCALGATGVAPYRTLLTHGFIVDKDGRKMSKSIGNTIEVEDLLRDFGADVCRWWVATLAYENDIKVDKSFIETAGEAYRKVRNTLRFMLSNLFDFTPCGAGENGMCVDLKSIPSTSIDAWALSKFDALSREVREAYDRFDFRAAAAAIYEFCNDAMSANYLGAVKDRLYCDRPDSPRRRTTQTVLWDIADGLCRLLAPILPHTADEAWRALRRAEAPSETVHLHAYLEEFGVPAHEGWENAMQARDAALLALETVRKGGGVENPLDAAVVLPDPEAVLVKFDRADLADLIGVSRVELDPGLKAPQVLDLRAEPRCERSWKRDGTVRRRSDGGMLSDRDAQAVGAA